MIPVRTFATDGQGRFGPQEFQATMANLFSVGLAVAPLGESPFWSRISAYEGRNLRFAALRFSEHATSSARATVPSSRLLVTVQKEGWSQVEQCGRVCRAEPGHFYIIDPSEPFRIETSEMLTHSVYVPKAAIRALMPEIDQLTAQSIDAREGTGALFGGLMDQMFQLGPALQETTADRIADALPLVLSAALSGTGAEVAPAISRLKASHRRRIMSAIRDHLSNPNLGPEMVAREVQLSTRHVYGVFEHEGTSLMKYVWNLRVERCASDLQSEALQGRSIAEIAYRWGFSDAAHFSRAFRERYGCSPREWRKQVQCVSKDVPTLRSRL